MFTLKTLRTTAAAGLLTLGCVAGFSTDAYAGVANAKATIDWNSLNISFIGDIGLAGENQFTNLSDTTLASAISNGVNPVINVGPNTTFDWDNGSFAQAETGNAHYNGNSTAETPNTQPESISNFKSESQVFSDRGGWNVSVNSTATRSGDFTVAGSGFVIISVAYNLFAEAGDGGQTLPNDTAQAGAQVAAILHNLTAGDAASSTGLASISAAFAESTFSDGFIAAILHFNSGDVGHLDISASSSASTSSSPVPVPAAGWLFGAAIMMMAARRRRA